MNQLQFEFRNILAIGFGGFLGTLARYGIGRWINSTISFTVSSGFPYATFIINVFGCGLIGFVYGSLEKNQMIQTPLYLFLTVGILGGFTTFSAFGLETLQLIKSGHGVYALLNVLGQIVLGIVAVFLGQALGSS